MREILSFIKISLKNTGYFYVVSSIILFRSSMNSIEYNNVNIWGNAIILQKNKRKCKILHYLTY